MSKDNSMFDHCRGSMTCPVCGRWVSYEEYIHNEGICDDCWDRELSEFEIYDRYDRGEDDE